jgi:hypothetical protein
MVLINSEHNIIKYPVVGPHLLPLHLFEVCYKTFPYLIKEFERRDYDISRDPLQV